MTKQLCALNLFFWAMSCLVLLSIPDGAIAQDNSSVENQCGISQMTETLEQTNPEELQAIEIAKDLLEEHTLAHSQRSVFERQGQVYIVPVVFHVIHNFGPENISDAQIHDALDRLNEEFRKLNDDISEVVPDFQDITADVEVEFRLAQLDPNGICTSGITRTASTLTYEGNQAMKNLIQWDRSMYLNIWVSASAGDGVAGYAYLPPSVNNLPHFDGIVIRYDYVGGIGEGDPSRARTLTHEVGHWLNLLHPWGGSNEPELAGNCSDDDLVGDTPNTVGWTSCSLGGTSCGTLDNVQNYMEYSGGTCRKMFTEGQKDRMRAALTSFISDRDELWQPANLVATGTDGNDVLCKVQFSEDRKRICAGESVQFMDESYHGVTEWSWEFEGGSPAVSSEQNPLVVFNSPGQYAVTLTAGNGTEEIHEVRDDYITVLSSEGAAAPYQEGFEELSSLPSQNWFVENPDEGIAWGVNTAVGFSGNHSVELSNVDNAAGMSDELISTTIDLSNFESIVLSFRYAYAEKEEDNNERLRFLASNDCGESWSIRKVLQGSSFPTVSPQTGPFVPAFAEEWKEVNINNLSSSYLVEGFRFKFEFQSDGGNNIFIDDINIDGSVGLAENEETALSVRVYPNPAKDRVSVSFQLEKASKVNFSLLDVMGRSIAENSNAMEEVYAAGSHELDFDLKNATPGLYFLRLSTDAQVATVRLTIE